MIQVIERVFTIPEELSPDGEVSLELLAKLTGLNKGTLCNILRSPIELGYVSRTGSSHYELTARFCELAAGSKLPESAMGKFRQKGNSLAETTGESGVLAVLRHDRVAVVRRSMPKCSCSTRLKSTRRYRFITAFRAVFWFPIWTGKRGPVFAPEPDSPASNGMRAGLRRSWKMALPSWAWLA